MTKKNNRVVIYGAGGHGKVIADIVEKSGKTVMAFVDDAETLWDKSIWGRPVWRGTSHLLEYAKKETFSVIIGIGDNHCRREIKKTLESAGICFAAAIHPSAQLANDVNIGEGTVIMANSVINPGARVGGHCIVNTAVVIGHDCIIDDFVHISSGSLLGGSVQVGHSSWIGLGATVINNIYIAEHAIIGAGSVVIRNVHANTVVVGNPAAFLRKNEKK